MWLSNKWRSEPNKSSTLFLISEQCFVPFSFQLSRHLFIPYARNAKISQKACSPGIHRVTELRVNI